MRCHARDVPFFALFRAVAGEDDDRFIDAF
jgi:hypothetical protein